MKNRKRIVVAFLLVAVMVIGVGYAALMDELTISGDATISALQVQNTFDENIHFVAVSADGTDWKEEADGYLAADADLTANGFRAWVNPGAGADVNDTAQFSIASDNLDSNGDAMVIYFKVHNEGTIDATDLKTTVTYSTGTDQTLFNVVVDLVDDAGDPKTTLPGGDELIAKVTVTLLKDPPAEGAKGNFTIKIDIKDVASI